MDSIVTTVWRALVGRAPLPAASDNPRVLPAYAALARYQLSPTDLEPRLRTLATQLAAERSGCRWCIDRGRHLWREARLPGVLLHELLQYEASSLFSVRERAALRFTDAVTRYSDSNGQRGMPLEPLMTVREHFSEPEVAALTAAVAAMHFFNPVTGALGADAEPREPRRSAWGAPIGSSLRNFWL